MNITEIEKNTTYYLEMFVTDASGEPVTGLSVSYSIYNSTSDALVTSGSLSEVGGGVYKVSYTFSTLGQFRVLYDTPSGYTDEIETVLVLEKRALQETLLRTLGLAQENYRIFNPVYNTAGEMTSSTIRVYSSASDVDTDTNPIASYSVTATYNAQNRMINYKVKKL